MAAKERAKTRQPIAMSTEGYPEYCKAARWVTAVEEGATVVKGEPR